jgi:hypothetical protein
MFTARTGADIKCMTRENVPWFLSSAVLVAVSQAFVYASLAVVPLMVIERDADGPGSSATGL